MENRELLSLLEELFGDLAGEHLSALLSPKRPGLRINTLRISSPQGRDMLEKRGYQLTGLGFDPSCFRVDYYPREMGRTPEHLLGLFYIQDPSSMLPVVVLDPMPGERVLDIAAAPGSKTTQAAARMKNRGLVIANEPDRARLKALHGNIDRCGCWCVATTCLDGRNMGSLYPGFFDRVLVDAPCSGLGTLHKNREIQRWWSWKKVARLVRTQKRLVVSGYDALRPGGRLLYSTCTLTPQENEGVVDHLLRERPGAGLVELSAPGVRLAPGLTRWGKAEFHPSLSRAGRIYPRDNPDHEGFFLALLEKPPGDTL